MITTSNYIPTELLGEFIRKQMDMNSIYDVIFTVSRFLDCKESLNHAKTSLPPSLPGRDGIVAFHQKKYDAAAVALERSLINHVIESIGIIDLNK